MTEAQKKTQLFESTPIPQAVFTLCVPTILSTLVMVLYNLADTYFVGMLNDPIQNAAVTLAAPVLLAFNAVNNLFGVGASSMMSRALGRKDAETVARSSAFGFWGSLLSALAFSLVYTLLKAPALQLLGADAATADATARYLLWTVSFGAVPSILNVVLAYLVRAEGEALHASIGTMSGCFLNIILDPIFILPWGLDMGAAGAGLATFLSNAVACLYFLVLIFIRRRSTCVCLAPGMALPRRAIVAGVCGVGVPAAIQNLLNVTGMTVLNNFTAAYGSDAVAAMGIASKINMIPMYVSMGISQGIMPLVSYNYASGNVRRMRSSVSFSSVFSVGFLVLATAAYAVWANGLIRLFMNNDAIVAIGGPLLRGMCFAMPFLCIDFLAVGVFQACGMGKKALLFAILRKVVLEIPALIILDRLFPLYGLAWAQTVAEFVLGCAAVLVLARLFKSLENNDTLGING